MKSNTNDWIKPVFSRSLRICLCTIRYTTSMNLKVWHLHNIYCVCECVCCLWIVYDNAFSANFIQFIDLFAKINRMTF